MVKDYRRILKSKNIIMIRVFQTFLDKRNNPHPLKGNWKNYMECHIENDTLLIWFDKENDAIELVRLGSHSELFGKGRKR